MRKSLVVLIAVIIAAMLCGCADDVSSVQQEDSSSRSSTKWTVTKVADDDISCEGLVLTALNSGDFPEMVKADRKSTRLNSSHKHRSRMPSSA